MKATTEIDAYVFNTLMADLVNHDRRPSAFLTYVAIWSAGEGKRVALSYADLAERTGLSKRAAQDAIAHLMRRDSIAGMHQEWADRNAALPPTHTMATLAAQSLSATCAPWARRAS